VSGAKRVVVLPAAESDLISIHRYVAAQSPEAADRLLRDLASRAQWLAARPAVGRKRLPRHPSVRVFRSGRYLLFYRSLEDDDGIELIRVVHTARDWTEWLEDNLDE